MLLELAGAAVAAVVANMALGMAWYGPLFGERWLEAMGIEDQSEEEKERMQQEAMPGYVVSMLGAVAATLVLWALFGWTTGMPEGITGPVKGLALGALAWVGFHAGPTLASSFFEEQDATVWAIGAGYWGSLALVYGLIVGILHP